MLAHNLKLIINHVSAIWRSVSTAMTGEGGRHDTPTFRRPSSCQRRSCAKPDIVRRFLAWAQSADADARAEGASALARAYLYSDLPPPMRAEAALAMTALLDDPSVLVRRALAEALCRACEAPRALILALAADEPEARRRGASALARADRRRPRRLRCERRHWPRRRRWRAGQTCRRRATAALAETGQHDAVLALIGNLEIDLPAELLGRIFDRFGDDASLRETLLERPVAAGELESAHRGGGGKGSGRRGVAVDVARASRARRPRGARSGDLYDRLVMPSRRAGGAHARAARSRRADAGLAAAFAAWRRTDLFAAGAGGIVGPAAAARRRLYPRAAGARLCRARSPRGLEGGVLPAFRAALAAIKTHVGKLGDGLKLSLVQKVIDDCEQRDDPALAKVRALLWRFAAEAAKAEAASFAREAAASASRRPAAAAPGVFTRQR